MEMKSIDIQSAIECINYNEYTGVCTWKKRGRGRTLGKEIGCQDNEGYIVFTLNCIRYKLHRVIYAINYGEIPEDAQIDHINGVTFDNRLTNLRLANSSEQQRNAKNKKNI